MDLSILAQAAEQAAETAQSGAVLGKDFVLGLKGLAGVVGAGLAVMGAAHGIGNLAGRAVEGIARQPEAGGRIFTSMIVAAALIEGFTFFALVIALLAVVAS